MTASTRRATAERQTLATLVQASDFLSSDLKRQWLRVLPYLNEADRERLRQILASSAASAGSPTDLAMPHDRP